MGKSAIDAKRGNVFYLEPERLTLVYDKAHPLYDPRVEDAPDESMVLNIAMNGVLEPIIVRKNGEAIEVVAGRGRTKATLEANRRLTAEGKQPILIPAMVRGGSDADLFGILITENEIRREDSIINKGIKARKLLNLGKSVQEIAIYFGVSRQAVDNWLAAEELPEEIKEAILSGEISATAATQLADLSKEEQVKRFREMKAKGVKATTSAMKKAATSSEVTPSKRLRSRKRIETELDATHHEHEDYERGFKDALRWVLGEWGE